MTVENLQQADSASGKVSSLKGGALGLLLLSRRHLDAMSSDEDDSLLNFTAVADMKRKAEEKRKAEVIGIEETEPPDRLPPPEKNKTFETNVGWIERTSKKTSGSLKAHTSLSQPAVPSRSNGKSAAKVFFSFL
jgi:hypothetical protein